METSTQKLGASTHNQGASMKKKQTTAFSFIHKFSGRPLVHHDLEFSAYNSVDGTLMPLNRKSRRAMESMIRVVTRKNSNYITLPNGSSISVNSNDGDMLKGIY